MTTSTAVARRVATTPIPSDDRGGDWRELLDLANEIAMVEGFVPRHLVGKPPAILATLLAGRELGFGPMTSLRSLYVIEGKVSLSAEAARGLIYAAGHSLEIEADDSRAVCRGKRVGESQWTVIEWTLDRARRANLAGRQVWRQYPRAMLVARASAELARVKFSDALLGFDVTEELAEELVEPATPAPNRRSRKRAAPALESPEDPLGARETPSMASPATEPQAPESGPLAPPLVEGDEGPPSTARGSRRGGPRPTSVPDWEPPPPPPPLDPEALSLDLDGPPADLDLDAPPPPPIPVVALRRIHARLAETFDDRNRAQLDRLRHGLVALVTRDRPGGPVQSATELTDPELFRLEAVLNYVRAGECLVADTANGFEFRHEGRCFAVSLDPPVVDVR